MDLIKIKEYIENQFTDDYEEIKQFMEDVNDTLTKINIDTKYNSYNDFCLDIEKYVIKLIEENNIETVSTQIIITALNNMVKYKILEDENYEEKIRNYFDEPDLVLDDINQLKVKNLKKKIK